MKKTLALLGSLLVLTGIKAQTTIIKKETDKPIPVDTLQIINKGISSNQTDKIVKLDKNIKITGKVLKTDKVYKESPKSLKTDAVKELSVEKTMKESPVTTKPIKD